MTFKDKIIIVTGASRGIGKATTIEFDKLGATVVGVYKSNQDAAKQTQSQLSDRSYLIQCDLTDELSVIQLVETLKTKHHQIDVLVNNAGEIIRPGDWKTDLNTWQKTLNINLTSAWLMTKEIVPIMRKPGVIINLASTVGLLGSQYVLPYSCAKEAIVALTKSFAKELAPDIRVNAVAPSNVMTDMTKGAGAEFIERIKQNTLLKRIAEPIELAKTILFLASDDASYITGHTLIVDGGYSLK